MGIFWEEIFRGGGGRGEFTRGEFDSWEFSGWELSWFVKQHTFVEVFVFNKDEVQVVKE